MDHGGPEDPFDKLLDPSFQEAPGPREASAEERAAEARAKADKRRAREAALLARLAEEERLRKAQAKQDRKAARRARVGPLRRVLSWIFVLGLVGAAAWAYTTGALRNSSAPISVGDSSLITQPPRPEDYPPADDSISDEPLGTPPPAPRNPGAFEFIATQPGTETPVAWDPCRTIRYVVNPNGEPDGARALLEDAIGRASSASGLRFEWAGSTNEVWSKQREPYQPDRYGERWAPVLVVWADEQEVPGLAGYIAGLAGPHQASAADGTRAFVSGTVALDRDQLSELINQGKGEQARAVNQHELGHLLGLDHVADPAQLMYSETGSQPVLDWGSGDLAGLHSLGTQECVPSL